MMPGAWGLWWIYPLLMVAFWVALVVGIVYLVKWLVAPRGAPPTGEPDALEILKRRYARGEIGKEEFEQKKRDLQ